MNGKLLFNIVLIGLCQSAIGSKDLPSYFPRCYRNDPKMNDCILKATEQVRPFLKKGVPELNIPSISPFHIPEISLELGSSSLNYKAYLRNVTFYGLDSYQFTKFDFDPKKLQFESAVNIPELYMEGDYFVDGRILVVPIEGHGPFHFNITNSNGTLFQQARIVNKKGVEFLESTGETVTKINTGNVVNYAFDGLFGGNQILIKAAHSMVQEHMRELIEEMQPAVEKILTSIFDALIFKGFSKIPYDKLYPL